MRFFYDNLIDYAATVITASSADAQFPAANVAHEHRSKPWRTGTSAAAEWIKFDLGSAKAVTSVILLDHTMTGSDTTIKLQGNATDSWGAPTVDQTLTYAADIISQVIASQTLRWWRVIFTKSAAGETRDIGRIYLGTYYTTTEQPDFDGWMEERQDLSTKQRARGGQTYSDARSLYRTFRADWNMVNQTQVTNFKTIAEAVGTHTSLFIIPDETLAASTPLGEILYVKLARAGGAKVGGFDTDTVWNVQLDFEEQL